MLFVLAFGGVALHTEKSDLAWICSIFP
jgi:hypothetical protein